MIKKSGIPGYEDRSEDEQRKELQRLLRRVFSTPEGKVAFNVLLTDLKYFDVCRSEGDIALSNYAKTLITERMGIVNTIGISDYMLSTNIEETE